MKIGIISPEFPPTIGGVETYAFQYVQALKRLRPEWEITVFTRPHPGGEISMPDVRVVPALRRRLRLDRRLTHEYRADAWHAMNAAYGWLAGEADRVVVTVHGNDFLHPYLPLLRPDLARFLPFRHAPEWLEHWERKRSSRRLRELLRTTLPRARCILTNSRYTERIFLQHFPACRGLTVPAMVGVAEEFFSARRRERGSAEVPRLITVSRLSEPRKNVDLVLRALACLKEEIGFVYRVVGDGRDRPRLEALAAELDIAERVEFVGSVPQKRVIELLGESDLFVLVSSVLPRSHEGFGIVYLEANACGTPVLAARLGGAVEAVAEGKSGGFVDVADLENITATLRSMLGNGLRFSAEECRRHARQFAWDRVTGNSAAYFRPRA